MVRRNSSAALRTDVAACDRILSAARLSKVYRSGEVDVHPLREVDFDLHGIVRRVEPFAYTKVSSLGIEEQRVNVIIDFAGADELDPNLGHGYRVVVRILMSHDRGALTVPWTVYALSNADCSGCV